MERMSGVRRCYECLLARVPAAEGSLTMGWHIEPGGRVNDVHVMQSTVGDAAMHHCVTGVLETMRYETTTAADATWSFGLKPPAQ